uniref:SGS domain-containing protein n=1 Tax=Globodera rostochiensis TaxID=31243 RepID=A0A914GZB5_GLORO
MSGPETSDDRVAEDQAKKTDLSSKYAQWERLAKELEKQEEEEEESGGVDSMFKKIYRDANDEVKKAMVKSFSESQGTVLSTNWNEVKKDQVEMKPPEGIEFKRFEK